MDNLNSINYAQKIEELYDALKQVAVDTKEYWDDMKQRECYSTYVDPVLDYLWRIKGEMESIQEAVEQQLQQARRTQEQYLDSSF